MAKIKRIRDAKDLPGWFNLANYDGTESLLADQWYMLIHKRNWIYRAARLRGKNSVLSPQNLRMIDVNRLFYELVDAPLNHSDYGDFASRFQILFDIPLYEEVSKFASYLPMWREAVKKELASNYCERPQYPYWRVPLFVDLRYSDEELKLRFDELIEKMRDQCQYPMITKRKRQYQIENWSECGLLPYVDLKLWEIISGNSITHSVMTDAINPPGCGSEDQTRKTVDKLAQELVFKQTGMGVFSEHISV
ncbi:DUF6387 family protein [Pseudomonadota bacterium]